MVGSALESSGINLKEAQGLAAADLRTEYRTGETDLVTEFYEPCLRQASRYDRAVGYFRSTILLIIGQTLIDFARQGGTMRVVCSPVLTEEDVEALARGYKKRKEIVAELLETELDRLLDVVDTRSRTEALATLVAVGAMELRIAVRPPTHGLYHEKIGVFTDKYGNVVSFKGSSNETWSGWHELGNFESVEVFCSWQGGTEERRVRRHQDYFERLWSGHVPEVEIFDFPRAVKEKLHKVAKPSLEDIILKSLQRKTTRRPLAHQTSALESWKEQGQRGILEHATASGKTFTAILAIREHVAQGGIALVLVPSRLLLKQWAEELRQEIPDGILLLAGAGNNLWRHPNRLRSFSAADQKLGPRVILATMQTACTAAFRERLSGGDHLMVVADEVHQTGSPEHSRLFEIDSGPRLGLSATPYRYGDPQGTRKLFDYFGPVVQPPFTLRDAINCGLLVEYEYFPHPLHLTAEEAELWRQMTGEIAREIAKLPRDEGDNPRLSRKAQLLLIQRSRIAKKAAGKVDLAVRVIEKEYEEGQRFLVYCEDREQLAQILDGLGKVDIKANEYHSAMEGDQAATLDWFNKFGGVLVSIRCLDEGIDIPEISHALILASSQNPRQFIQRRGRVLRRVPGKYMAVIHDAIVVPVNVSDEPEQITLLKSEFARAFEFAQSAINRFAAAELRNIAAELGFDPEQAAEVGMEEDEEE